MKETVSNVYEILHDGKNDSEVYSFDSLFSAIRICYDKDTQCYSLHSGRVYLRNWKTFYGFNVSVLWWIINSFIFSIFCILLMEKRRQTYSLIPDGSASFSSISANEEMYDVLAMLCFYRHQNSREPQFRSLGCREIPVRVEDDTRTIFLKLCNSTIIIANFPWENFPTSRVWNFTIRNTKVLQFGGKHIL